MLEAIFNEVIHTVTISKLFQWDYGRKLYIKGVELDEVMEVHFSNSRRKEAIVMVATKHDDYYVVDIPNDLLEECLDIYSWVYAIGDNSGETVKTVILKVEPRNKPQDFVSENPDSQDLLADVIDKINNNIKDNAEFKEDLAKRQDDFEKHIESLPDVLVEEDNVRTGVKLVFKVTKKESIEKVVE